MTKFEMLKELNDRNKLVLKFSDLELKKKLSYWNKKQLIIICEHFNIFPKIGK